MAPVYRWYPVLQRYIEIVSRRVNGAGGVASSIPPSFQGYPTKGSRPGDHDHDRLHDHEEAHTGKIVGLIFDRFGDFEGFLLDTEPGEHRFFSRERDMKDLVERAWHERLRVTVFTKRHEPRRPHTVILRDPPAKFWS